MVKDVFGFAERQQKATNDLAYNLTLTKNIKDDVLTKTEAIADALITIDRICWFVPYYTPSIPQQGKLSKQFLSEALMVLRFIVRSVFMQELNNQNLRNFEWGSQESMNVPTYVIITFQQTDRQDSQNQNNDKFFKLPGTNAQCIFETEKNSDAGTKTNYEDGDYSQGNGQRKEAFRTLTKDDFLKPHISDQNFKSSSFRADAVADAD